MAKSITEQIDELQKENERLKSLEKDVDKLIQTQLGMKRKDIEKALKNGEKSSAFENKIVSYFDLKKPEDMNTFLSIICSESTLNFYQKKRDGE